MNRVIENRVFSPDEISVVAHDLVAVLADTSVLAFSGPLGAGKTTMVQSILKQVGVDEVIQSPTFTYVVTYEAQDGTLYHHFDLYRLSSVEDFLVSGFDEYLFQAGSKALIEWPEVIEPLLMHDTCHVLLDYEGTARRTLSCWCV
ncbi:TPA: tRNA (adenosine(37)-N6)-threonylcarbamoyltransferase complex ATPase subunit type 1 TsaE [Candidatus Dependentiae bacterium]|nr:MAG: Hydrolase, P-loop family [candidate division TM6 bacterium GW2011_GWF2_43_87]HBL98417.1 tRNA (adenosine(37)-N6)-threonylcarbamoyltransferase complex ATPase subunit type 1 TsaE [Candidatus Dependentiae bacterium]